MKVFVGFGYRPDEQPVVRGILDEVEAILESHGAHPLTGEYLGGEAVTPAIRKAIQEADATIALLTPRDLKQNGRYSPPAWVAQELVIARENGRPAIAVVHRDVEPEGAYQEHERIDYDPDRRILAILKLSHTVGKWRREAGRWLRIGLLPEELARLAGSPNARCEYRLSRVQDAQMAEWAEARLRREPGGTFAYVSGVQDDMHVELRVEARGQVWSCPATPQAMTVQLEPEA